MSNNNKIVNLGSAITAVDSSSKIYIDNQAQLRVDNHLNTEKLAKLVSILCEGDLGKVKKVIESELDRELSQFLIKNTHNLEEEYLLHIFTIYTKSFSQLSIFEQEASILITIAEKIKRRSYVNKCIDILDNSSINIINPTIYATLRRDLNMVLSEIPNSMDFIKED